MYRSIICCLLIASLIICSTNVCFANPLDPWSDVETQIVTSGVQDIVSDVDTIRVALSTLYSYLTNNGDGVIEGLLVIANRISNIINTLDYYVPREYAILQDVYSFLAPHAGSNQDIWNLVNTIVSNTTAISTGQLGIAQDVYNISRYCDAFQSKLTTLNQTEISSLAKLTNIDSNVYQVESQLTNINTNINSLNDINWITMPNSKVRYSYDGITFYSYNDIPTPTISNKYLYIEVYDTSINSDSLMNLRIPFWISYNNDFYPDVTFYNVDPRYTFSPDYYILKNQRSFNFFIFPYNSWGTTPYSFYIKLDFSDLGFTFYKNSSDNSYIKFLTIDSNDFYTVDNFIQSHKQSEDTTLSDIKNILIDIDNNSDFIQNNNDLQINVDIDASDGRGITAIISKLQDLFDFGISLQEFLVTLNQFDNLQWFTTLKTYNQVNYDPTNNLGYQNLYD